MAVITITIIESTTQLVSGIPETVSISTNIPATIFYTLDGTQPSLFSTIYTGTLTMPTNQTTVQLNVFASDGVDTSPIVENTYQPDWTDGDIRFPHSATNVCPEPPIGGLDPAPFGAPPLQPRGQYIGTNKAGLTVDDPVLPQVSTGFDADGNPAGFTNGQDPFGIPTKGFGYLYSTSNEEGETGVGIGNFPPHTVIRPIPPPEQSNMNSPFFDPRALVVIQDTTQPINPLAPININRMHFSLEDVEHTRTGNQMYNRGLDSPPVTGGFTKRYYNPVDNSLTFYYFDSTQNKWLISKQPFNAGPNLITDYSSGMVIGGQGVGGSRFVFQWVPNKASYLI